MRATYSDPQTRGRLRVFKQRLSDQTSVLDPDRKDPRFAEMVHLGQLAICKGGEKGRERALRRLSAMMRTSGGTLFASNLQRGKGKSPYLLWRLIEAQRSPFAAPLMPAHGQDCVVVNYLMLSRETRTVSDFDFGLWGLVVPDHALGRALHRSPAEPLELITEAHNNLLGCPVIPLFDQVTANACFYLRAGPGAFICTMGRWEPRPEDDPEYERLWMFCNTWIADDMLQEGQVPLARDLAAEGPIMFGTWLCPPRLRAIIAAAPAAYVAMYNARIGN